MKYTVIIILSILLIGCSSLKDYKFGDVSKAAYSKIKVLNEQYCGAENETLRSFLLTAIRMEVPAYPAEGFCGVRKTVKEIFDQGIQ